MSGIPFKPEGKLEGAYAPSIIIIYPLPLKKEGGKGDGFPTTNVRRGVAFGDPSFDRIRFYPSS